MKSEVSSRIPCGCGRRLRGPVALGEDGYDVLLSVRRVQVRVVGESLGWKLASDRAA